MKRIIFVGLFIFSIVLNIAVAATLGWHLWRQNSFTEGASLQEQPMTREDWRQLKNMMSSQDRSALREARLKVIEKKLELLDMMAKNPGNLQAVEPTIKELAVLKERVERQAIARISAAMAAMPEDRRQTFAALLKKRACTMPGMRFGQGQSRHGKGRGNMGFCPTPASERDTTTERNPVPSN